MKPNHIIFYVGDTSFAGLNKGSKEYRVKIDLHQLYKHGELHFLPSDERRFRELLGHFETLDRGEEITIRTNKYSIKK